MDASTVGGRVVALRKARGWKQSDLAEALGLRSAMPVSRWERGEVAPRADHLVGLARVFGTTVEALLAAADDHPPIVAPAAPVEESRS